MKQSTPSPKPSDIIIFCDGACLGNPGPGAAAFIIASAERVVEFVESAKETTNNRMEILALLRALQLLFEDDFISSSDRSKEIPDVHVYTDSKYVMQALQDWLPGWRRRGWITATGDPVKNRDLWEQFSDQWLRSIIIHHVRGHRGIPGNERCDELASLAAADQVFELYRGSRADYTVDLHVDEALPDAEPYYLSYIDGILARDSTWKACEARVKGKRSAKYKKVRSPQEEAQTLKLWGLPGTDSTFKV